jgi:hypothetical protein
MEKFGIAVLLLLLFIFIYHCRVVCIQLHLTIWNKLYL